MKRLLWRLLVSVVAGACLLCACQYVKPQPKLDVIRLHIIANSDQAVDQQAKYAVRNQLLEDWSGLLSRAADAQDALRLVEDNREALLEDVQTCLANAGMTYGASLKTGIYDFPTREYGGVTYPAGSYEAVRIVLGDGEGANWWCVLFPPLCMMGADTDFNMDSYKAALKEYADSLPDEDTPSQKDDTQKQSPPRAPIRSKLLDKLMGDIKWDQSFAEWARSFWLEN